ncbi:response regulator [Tardiphaga sp.]|uniref:response regulator n=1 Tax=Tardiphaga sp. TaxID=1926292 RepID=UPI00352B2000
METLTGSTANYSTALVVEDEPLVRTYVAEVLMDAGYRVFEACDALDALAILGERRDVHIVLTDIEMPGGMDGLELAGTIRSRWPEIVILVHSGRVRPAAHALPLGAGFIAKPYRADELLRELEELVERHSPSTGTDEDILDAWHATELAQAQAPPADKPFALAQAMAAEQAAIERFGRGPHIAAYDARFPDAPERGG